MGLEDGRFLILPTDACRRHQEEEETRDQSCNLCVACSFPVITAELAHHDSSQARAFRSEPRGIGEGFAPAALMPTARLRGTKGHSSC